MQLSKPTAPRTLPWLFEGPNGIRALWRLILFLAILESLLYGEGWLVRRTMQGADRDSVWFVNELSVFLFCLLAAWIMAKLEGRSIAQYGLPARLTFRKQFWQGAAVGFVAITLLLTILRLCGVFYFGKPQLHGSAILQYAALYGFVFLLVAFKEEFYARGYTLFTLTTGIGFWPSAILTSAYFGFSHRGNQGETWAGMLSAAGAGLLFCFMLRRTGNLWMAIGFHATWDWGQSYFYGVPDSAVILPGHLFEPHFAGPAWLTGGTVGPEGSWLCPVFLAALMLALAKWLPEAKYPDRAALGPRQVPSDSPAATLARS
jgi:uncharacterized protein